MTCVSCFVASMPFVLWCCTAGSLGRSQCRFVVWCCFARPLDTQGEEWEIVSHYFVDEMKARLKCAQSLLARWRWRKRGAGPLRQGWACHGRSQKVVPGGSSLPPTEVDGCHPQGYSRRGGRSRSGVDRPFHCGGRDSLCVPHRVTPWRRWLRRRGRSAVLDRCGSSGAHRRETAQGQRSSGAISFYISYCDLMKRTKGWGACAGKIFT